MTARRNCIYFTNIAVELAPVLPFERIVLTPFFQNKAVLTPVEEASYPVI